MFYELTFYVNRCLGELVTNGTESFPVVLQPAASAAERFRGIIVRQRRSGLY